ncbi:hypothetical protein RND81_04G013500 [Saponaria officinalis]|uniref:Uncharacterized protein n=1 Tax=Saponaria officinalis TaxID=3572 RepID=A0AAW1LGV4_SAPOF
MGVNSNRVEDLSSHNNNNNNHANYDTTINIQNHQLPNNNNNDNNNNNMSNSYERHHVCLPLKRSTIQKLKNRLSEIFFPENPLHKFKNQTIIKKIILRFQFFFPSFSMGSLISFEVTLFLALLLPTNRPYLHAHK